MNKFLTSTTQIPSYMMFPRFLINCNLSETAKLLYMVLLDRARISMKNEKWKDQDGHVFLYFTIQELSHKLKKSETTIKSSLQELRENDLIRSVRQTPGSPSRIYVKIPDDQDEALPDRNLPVRGKENCLSDRQKADSLTDGKLPINKKKEKNKKEQKRGNNSIPAVYGTYKNVYLTNAEYENLRATISDYDQYIEQLSAYMESSGKSYNNHAATIKSWALRDNKDSAANRKYECGEDESL